MSRLRLTAGAHSFVVDPARAGLRVDVNGMLAQAVQESRSGGLAHRFLRDLEGRRVQAAIPLQATLSRAVLARTVANVALVVDRPARPATVVPTATSLHVVPEQTGVAVDQPRLRAELAAALLQATGPRTVAVLFDKPTLRTQASFASGIDFLGRPRRGAFAGLPSAVSIHRTNSSVPIAHPLLVQERILSNASALSGSSKSAV